MQHLKSFDRNRSPTGLLVASTDVQRRRRINSDYEISFMVPMTSADYKEKIIPKGYVQDERGQFYVVQSRGRDRNSKVISAQVICTHIMFKMIDFKIPYNQYIDEAYGVHITTLLDRITAATGGVYTFVLHDVFALRDVKDWGRTTALAGLNDVINLYGCEIEPDNTVIHLYKRIGKDDGFQYRLGKNIISDSFKDDASNLTTRLFSQMKDGRTFIGLSADYLTAEERSLLESVPGAIVDNKLAVNYLISPYAQYWTNNVNVFYDGELIDQNIEDPKELLIATREALRKKEMPEFEIGVSAADIHKIDPDEQQPGLGDTVYAYDPDMELQRVSCRVLELTEYPFAMDKHSQATLSNHMMRDDTQVLADLERSKQILNDLLSGGRVRASAFEEFAKQAVIDINASKTEIKYDGRGIVLQSTVNALDQVIMTSNGIIVTRDGGATAMTAITANGVSAPAVVGILGNFVQMKIGEGENVTQINLNGIAAGRSDFHSAPFRVYMNGDVVARSITLTGLIEASKMEYSDIVAGTITGAKIRTSVTGARFEVDETGWRTFDSSGSRRIGIYASSGHNMSAITFDQSNGELSGLINGGDGLFEVRSSGNSDLFLSALTNTIFFQGQLNFAAAYSASGFKLEYVSGLRAELDSIWSALAGKASIGHSHSVTIPNHNHGNPANANSGGGTFSVS
ncbi:phage tail protein [Paenibacillus agri]|uniref:Phage tail protein n=1 Tax=Paenibacillus agri TaxID=2744309 RepID=A0A850EEW1_9BACL|nr:phage tail protein [Paenibacillus agri]NUU58976.1 phage tail protein [Paenibacillus agri]